MNTSPYRWDEFEINYYYPVTVHRLFKAWATMRGLKSFFIEEITIPGRSDDGIIAANDSYAWRWRHDYSLSGKFTAVVPNEKIAFTFGSMLVTILFHSVEGGSLLQLRQSQIPVTAEAMPTSHMNCRICWTFFMTNLKSIFLTGTDLRDADPKRASSFEVGYQPAH